MLRGDYVFKFGDFGDKFYVILRGEVSVRIPDPKNKNRENTTPATRTNQSVNYHMLHQKKQSMALPDKKSVPMPTIETFLTAHESVENKKVRAKSIFIS
jgi:hypothetical protein